MPKSALKRTISSGRHKSRHFHKPTRANWGIAALAFLAGIILFGKLGILTGSITDSSKKYCWDGTSTINLVVKSDHLYVTSFNPQDKSLSVLKVPDETYVDVSLGFGRWPIRSVYDLGQAENPPIGSRLLKETVSTSFGVPIDGYLVVSDNFEKLLEKDRKNPLAIFSLMRQGKTDLSFIELLKFWWGVKGVRFDKLSISNIGASYFTSWKLLSDGSRVLDLDRPSLDQFIQDKFGDSKLRSDGPSIGVFNTTNHAGLADQAARAITNMGGRVVFTANSEEHLAQSMVLGKSSYTMTRLAQVFAPVCLPKSRWPFGLFSFGSGCAIGSLQIDTQKADIIVALGEDYFARYNSR